MGVLRVSDWRAGLEGISVAKRLGAVQLDGTKLEVATDGHAMAIVDAGPSSAMPFFPDDAAKVRATVLDLWTLPVPEYKLRMTLRVLLSAVGAPDRPRKSTCQECGGSKRNREADGDCECFHCRCDYCDGVGIEEHRPDTRKRFVRGFTTRFNANLLALTIDSISGKEPDEQIALFDLAPTLDAIMVAGASWRVAVMAMRIDDNEEGLGICCPRPPMSDREVTAGENGVAADPGLVIAELNARLRRVEQLERENAELRARLAKWEGKPT